MWVLKVSNKALLLFSNYQKKVPPDISGPPNNNPDISGILK
jgi:hypothetical protein